MGELYTYRHQVINARLSRLVKCMWRIVSDGEVSIDHQLLPILCSDIIVNLNNSSMVYSMENGVYDANKIHINSLKKGPCRFSQSGKIDVIGISFFPLSIYPFTKICFEEVDYEIFDLDTVEYDQFLSLDSNISNALSIERQSEQIFYRIENALLSLLDPELIADQKLIKIFNIFAFNYNSINIGDFCNAYGVNERWLQREFKKYVGISPIKYLRLCRFRNILNKLENSTFSLTDLGYDSGYYDQSHLIREFKAFTGVTPKQFRKNNNWVKYKLNDV